ncbi:hypothetical protein E2C01_045924 [Portunus trituberculatus]|uniref:Uncharacterized protein n=1 Tax=Portunus trituberculatus TaxID=210409 RepID=A0A5B7G697_PORTR|nr:hypothetical protein [Portunus trituberculatus]
MRASTEGSRHRYYTQYTRFVGSEAYYLHCFSHFVSHRLFWGYGTTGNNRNGAGGVVVFFRWREGGVAGRGTLKDAYYQPLKHTLQNRQGMQSGVNAERKQDTYCGESRDKPERRSEAWAVKEVVSKPGVIEADRVT